MKLLVVATEASADLHLSLVLRHLKSLAPTLQVAGVCGDKSLFETPVNLLAHANELSVMGFTEVLPKVPFVLSLIKKIAGWAQAHQPDCALLIDSPDFNLRLAKKLKKLGVPVIYYICPQVWAWRSGRVSQMKQICDRILSILPFEPKFFAVHGAKAEFVGHPLLEEMDCSRIAKAAGLFHPNADPARPWIALLPGSRKSEVSRLIPSMAATIRSLKKIRPEVQVWVPRAPGIPSEMLAPLPADGVIDGQATTLLRSCDVGLIASGTASLQAALCQIPSVVTYQVSWVSSIIFRLVVRYKGFIAMPNIILNKQVFPELVQHFAQPEIMAHKLNFWLESDQNRQSVVNDLKALPKLLAPPTASTASESVANILMSYSEGRNG